MFVSERTKLGLPMAAWAIMSGSMGQPETVAGPCEKPQNKGSQTMPITGLVRAWRTVVFSMQPGALNGMPDTRESPSHKNVAGDECSQDVGASGTNY